MQLQGLKRYFIKVVIRVKWDNMCTPKLGIPFMYNGGQYVQAMNVTENIRIRYNGTIIPNNIQSSVMTSLGT